MNWTQRMNAAIDEIEAHLLDPIDEARISRITACPYSAFQNAFTQVCGVSPAEYIRRRRLTLAAYELQNTAASVTDVAFKYGYSSPDSFRVAFKHLHGVAPSYARFPGTTLAFYCAVHFQLQIRGIEKMEYTLFTQDAFTVIGVRRTTPYGGGTWAVVKSDGSNERAAALYGRFFDLGLCFGFGTDGSNDYMCALRAPEGTDARGFDTYDYPACTWLRLRAQGKISDNVLFHTWQRIHGEFLPDSRFELNGQPTIERYVLWDEAADQCDVEIDLPVREKA